MKQKHRGAAWARNAGVALAKGRLVSFLDSDDVWLPGKTETELAVFERHPDVDAVVSDSERWRDHELVCSSWLADRGVVVSGDAPTPMRVTHLEKGKTFATCSLTIKRDALARLGTPLFDTTLETHEDLDFAIRMQRCCSIMIVPKTLAQVRRFNDGSRVGRPLPGTEYPPALKRVMAYRRYRVFDRALAQDGWSAAALPYLQAGRSEAARDFCDHLPGWPLTGMATIVTRELRHANLASAASIVMRALLPGRAAEGSAP